MNESGDERRTDRGAADGLRAARIRRVRIPGAAKLPEGEARKVLVPEPGAAPRELVLARYGGKLCALDSLCPHEGGRLAEGPLWEGRYLHCPLHLYRFDPESGQAVDVDCKSARTYVVHEQDGVAEIELPPGEGEE